MALPESHDEPARERPPGGAAPTPVAERLGPAVLGMFAGLVLGAIVAVLVLARDPVSTMFATCVFGGAGLGFLLGALSTDIGFGLFEGVAHLLAGLAAGGRAGSRRGSDGIRPSASASAWLRGVFWVGVILAVVAAILLHWH